MGKGGGLWMAALRATPSTLARDPICTYQALMLHERYVDHSLPDRGACTRPLTPFVWLDIVPCVPV